MKKKRICLDPGHYGKRYNAGAVSGYYESVIMWNLTQYEKEYLEQMGIEVIVTRSSTDENPDLTTRGKMAAGCDLFVSNHTNACGTESVNRAVVIYFTDRDETLVDDRSREFAMQLAKVIQSTMGVNGCQIYSKLSDNDRDGNGEKDDNYYGVLHGSFLAGVPGVIAEHSFHTNVAACKWLMDETNLRKLAKACAECMAAYVGVSAPVDDGTQAAEFAPYRVSVRIDDLNMRLGATIDTASIGHIPVGTYTIVEEKTGKVSKKGKEGLWGRIKSEQPYNGRYVSAWICLSYTEKV